MLYMTGDNKWDRGGFDQPDGVIVSREWVTKTPEAQHVRDRTEQYETVVLKVPGHKVWTGNHDPWAYFPAEYQVFRVLHQDSPTRIAVVFMFSFPVRNAALADAGRKRLNGS